MEKTKVAVVVVPLTAQGHLNQLLHFSRLISSLSSTHNSDVTVHFASTETHVRQATARVQGWDPSAISNVHFHGFETARVGNPRPDPDSKLKFPSQLIPSMRASITDLREPVCSLVRSLSSAYERVIVVYDSAMAHTVQDVSSVANAEAYCFHSISAFALFSYVWEFAGRPDALLQHPEAEVVREVPSNEGCIAPEFEQITKLIREAPKVNCGDIYNTSRVIEGLYLDLLAKGKMTGTDRVWAIGPFHPLSVPSKSRQELNPCLEWLDEQEPGSVIFVSFGSTTSLSNEEVSELARGLERSGIRFIWVLRDADRGDVFDGEGKAGRELLLPKGYEEKIESEKRGLIVRGWAPQLEILGHSSTGGFLSHCGWNSCIESISTGVPMATWPMHSDQPRNAVLVTKVLKIGLQLRDWDRRDEAVSGEKIEEVVRRLMCSDEGDELRRRAKKLAGDVKMSFAENGIASSEMDSFLQHICR